MRKLLNFLLSISTVFSFVSCDGISDKISGVEETDENNIQNSVQDDTPSSDEKPKQEDKPSSEEKPSQEDTTPSDDNPTPTGEDDEGTLEQPVKEGIYIVDQIELDVRGETGDSAFSNEITIPYGSINVSKFDITCSLEEEGDTEFFNITTTNDSVTVKAIGSSRFTHLNVTYKKKGTSIVAKNHSIILLSNTIGFLTNLYTIGKYGEEEIEKNKYADIERDYISKTESGKDFYKFASSSNNKYDLVIPSKAKVDGQIREVVRYSAVDFNEDNIYTRKTFFPDTILVFANISFIYHRCSQYVHFAKSKKGYLMFAYRAFMSTDMSLNPGNSYFLKETASDNDPQSRFFAGPDYYYFPYTKVGASGSYVWNKGDVVYKDWDWQTNYVSLYNTSSYREAKRFLCQTLCCRY